MEHSETDQTGREPHRLEEDLMRRLLVIETEPGAAVPNRVSPGEPDVTLLLTCRGGRGLWPLPLRIIGRVCFVARKRMQNIGEQ